MNCSVIHKKITKICKSEKKHECVYMRGLKCKLYIPSLLKYYGNFGWVSLNKFMLITNFNH